MDGETLRLMAEIVATCTAYALLFGAGVTGLVFVGVLLLWVWDQIQRLR